MRLTITMPLTESAKVTRSRSEFQGQVLEAARKRLSLGDDIHAEYKREYYVSV